MIFNFGDGGIAHGIYRHLSKKADLRPLQWVFINSEDCDVRNKYDVMDACSALTPRDWVIVTAGIDDEDNPTETIKVNLLGSLNVAQAATDKGASVILLASLAGLYGKPGHVAYCASKAAVISIVESLGFKHRIWAISPGHVDTPMRDRRYPLDTPGSRLDPEEIGVVVADIMKGVWAPGANIIYRKIGNDAVGSRIQYGEAENHWGLDLNVGKPVTI